MLAWGLALFVTDDGGAKDVWVWPGDALASRLIGVMLLTIAATAVYALVRPATTSMALVVIGTYGIAGAAPTVAGLPRQAGEGRLRRGARGDRSVASACYLRDPLCHFRKRAVVPAKRTQCFLVGQARHVAGGAPGWGFLACVTTIEMMFARRSKRMSNSLIGKHPPLPLVWNATLASPSGSKSVGIICQRSASGMPMHPIGFVVYEVHWLKRD